MKDFSGRSTEPADKASMAGTPLGNRERAIVGLVELLFFAYRDFTRDPDDILAEFNFGRAHHRVLHFVDRYPGLRVADLLDILKITKQSLARVLRQLVASGFIEQRLGEADRRERRLYVTDSGQALAVRLLAPQIRRMQEAINDTHGATEAETVRSFLFAMIETEERRRVEALLAGPGGHVVPKPEDTP